MSKYWEPCPRCGSNKVQANSRLAAFFGIGTGIGCLSLLFFPLVFLIFPLLLVIPFLPKTNTCQDCKHAWKVDKKSKEASA